MSNNWSDLSQLLIDLHRFKKKKKLWNQWKHTVSIQDCVDVFEPLADRTEGSRVAAPAVCCHINQFHCVIPLWDEETRKKRFPLFVWYNYDQSWFFSSGAASLCQNKFHLHSSAHSQEQSWSLKSWPAAEKLTQLLYWVDMEQMFQHVATGVSVICNTSYKHTDKRRPHVSKLWLAENRYKHSLKY